MCCVQAMAPVAELAHCVHLSGACAVHFVRNGAPSVLIHFMRSCNRSAPHLSMFRCVHSLHKAGRQAVQLDCCFTVQTELSPAIDRGLPRCPHSSKS